MFKSNRIFLFLALGCVFLLNTLSSSNFPVTAQEDSRIECAPLAGEAVTIASAKLYIEYNATDGDLGVHGSFDDHGWSELCVYAPDGTQILGVGPEAQLGDLTIAGIFFESREPELDEFGFAELVASFPEGEYEVRGLNYDGSSLTGYATFSHNVPAEPTIVYPLLAEDEEEAAEALVPTDNFVVEWEPVTETVDGNPVEITGYEVIITMEEYDDPHGFSQPIFDVHVGADKNSLTISPEFIQSDTLYELEILALEVSGNQTISVGFFTTE